MEQDGEFSDSHAPPPIEQSSDEKILPLESEKPSLPHCEDGPEEDEEAAVGAQGTDDSQLLGSPAAEGDEVEDPIFEPAAAGDEEEAPILEPAASGDEEEAPILEPAASGDEEEAPVFEADRASHGDEAVGEEAMEAVKEETMEMTMEGTEPSVDAASKGGGKRKRGRPPKARAQALRPPAKKKEEEDVCFICFDGGNLVVCDRRGCPKVYHPPCVNRDESFFRSRGRWNCGWHICSICQKAVHYMCYTCTYSLCKGCIKEAGFVCVRGNKGFCEVCYRTVMLLESKQHANEEKVGADFDLFKEYWLDLKGKLSITLEELNTAKNPWKGSGVSTRTEESSDELYDANDDQGASPDSSSGRREGSSSSRKKVSRRPRITADEENSVKQVDGEGASMPEDTEWASKELLEFVAHMKGGDKSVLSQFDVQALLLEYIKQNNLRDPRRKSQIICDPRLQNLFGKGRVGHFEMLKLLELHFLIKEASQVVTDDNQGGIVDPDSSQMDAEGYSDPATKMSSDKRRKTRKKVEEREPQTNLDDYAAIDVHNINLIYLRRNLMEDLLDDIEKFNEKVVGSFIRIRIPGMGQRQDMYRLVQVVGTHKAAETYKSGRRTTDVKLDILNLNKTEVISIDSISNQEFTEEECKRLRQSIKCGFISRLTVGDIQEKVRVLQAVRVNDWLESEKLRLGHLRDRASEKGRRKELRECVEKLQLLSTPEERWRRLNEVAEIHADPNMDPKYESDDEGKSDDKDQDNYKRSRESSFLRKGREVISPGRGGSATNWGDARKSSNTTWESSRNTPTEGARDKVDQFNSMGDGTNELSWNQGKDMHQTSNRETPKTQTNSTGLESDVWNSNQPALSPRHPYGAATETTLASLPTGGSLPSNTSENEKMWHYHDPSGKIQGPFSMTQLRKWSTTGYFPPGLRIWRASEKQDDSIFLTDALIGKFQKDLPEWELQHNKFPQATTFAAAVDSRENKMEGGWRGNNHPTLVDSKQNRGNWGGTGNTEQANADMWASQSSTWSALRTEVATPRERGWESSNDTNARSDQPQGHSSPSPTAPLSGNPYGPPPYQGRGNQGGGNSGRWDRGQDRGDTWSSNKPRGSRPSSQGYDLQHSNWSSSGQQASGDILNVRPANDSRNQWGNDSFNLPTPTPQPSIGGWTSAQGPVKTSVSPTVPVQPVGSGWGTAPSTGINGALQFPTATMEHNRANPVVNPLGGWGSSSAASASMPNMAYKAVQIPERDAPNILENYTALLPMGDIIPSTRQTVFGVSSVNAFSGGLNKNQFFESDCPSPTPRSERNELPTVQHRELDPRKKWAGANKSWGSDPPFVAPALETLDPPANSRPEVENLQSASSASAEAVADKYLTDDMQKLANSKSLPSEPQDNMSPIAGTEEKITHPLIAKPTAEYSVQRSVSAQRSEASELLLMSESQEWALASVQKQDPNGSSLSLTPSRHGWEHNQIQKPEPSISGPEPVKNLDGPPDVIGGEWSMPSPTPVTKPSVWNAGADSTSGNSQNNPWVSSDGSRLPASSRLQAGTSSEPTQPGWGTGTKDVVPLSGWAVAPPNPNTFLGPAQGNANTGWGTAIQGNTITGRGTMAQGNPNVAWGTPAQGNANVNMGWRAAAAAAQVSTNPNTDWGTPQQGNTHANTGWVTPAQGSTIASPGWGMTLLGNTNPNVSWGALAQGNATNLGWGQLTQGGSNTNSGWGTPTLEANANVNAGRGTGLGNTNAGWGLSSENPNSWDPQHNQNGERYKGGRGGDSGHGSGRNNRMQYGNEGGGSSRPLPRGQAQRGVCIFHESGHCKKGASCNYLHS